MHQLRLVGILLTLAGWAIVQGAGAPEGQRGSGPADPGWLRYGLDEAETHYSPLDQITTKNVARMGLDWSTDLDAFSGQIQGHAARRRRHVVQHQSVECGVRGRCADRSAEVAVGSADSAPDVQRRRARQASAPRAEPLLRARESRRRVSRWEGLRRHTGQPARRARCKDRSTGVDDAGREQTDDYSITGAPRVISGRVITGTSGAEFGVRGFVAAYDANTGKEVWRFWTVPGDPSLPFENAAMEKAAATWTGAWWKYGGGGTPWDGMAYDPTLDLLFIGTGNGSPWARELRSPGGGDNLYLCSIVALRPATGEYVWHFQTTPADNWDYASTQPIVLAYVTIDGRPRKVLMQGPKNGFFYVIDRATGGFISAQPFTPVTWATGVDPKTGCHPPTVVTGFRLPEQAWRATIADMVNRGMHGTKEQHDAILKYLAKYRGPATQ